MHLNRPCECVVFLNVHFHFNSFNYAIFLNHRTQKGPRCPIINTYLSFEAGVNCYGTFRRSPQCPGGFGQINLGHLTDVQVPSCPGVRCSSPATLCSRIMFRARPLTFCVCVCGLRLGLCLCRCRKPRTHEDEDGYWAAQYRGMPIVDICARGFRRFGVCLQFPSAM